MGFFNLYDLVFCFVYVIVKKKRKNDFSFLINIYIINQNIIKYFSLGNSQYPVTFKKFEMSPNHYSN